MERRLPHTVLGTAALAVAVGAAGVAALSAPADAPAGSRSASALLRPGDDYLLEPIARARHETWRWQQLMGRSRTRNSPSARRSLDPDYRRWVLRLWRGRALRMRRLAARPPHRGAWLCIQQREGPWNDPHGPYYGGLQMNLTFQRRHGHFLLRRKGTAENWTPLEQMWIAERAHRSGLGFWPWPSTARFCRLL